MAVVRGYPGDARERYRPFFSRCRLPGHPRRSGTSRLTLDGQVVNRIRRYDLRLELHRFATRAPLAPTDIGRCPRMGSVTGRPTVPQIRR